jgi:O-antigen ligase
MSLRKLAYLSALVFTFIMPWERNIAVPGLGALGTPVGLLMVLLAVVSTFQNYRFKLRPPPVFMMLMGIFIFWSFATYFWSFDPAATLRRSTTYLQLFVMILVLWHLVRTAQERQALMQAYVMGAYVAVVAVIANFLMGNAQMVGSVSARYSFAGSNPNWLALSLALALPMAWYLVMQRQSSFWTVVNVGYLALGVLAIALTGSRGGFITSVVALSIIPMSYWHLSLWRKVALLVLLGGALYGAFVMLPQTNLDRLMSASEEITEGTMTGRTRIWEAGLDLLEADGRIALWGVGSGAFQEAVEPLLGGRGRPAHNAYLSVFVDLGFVGLLLFLAHFALSLLPTLSLAGPQRIFSIVLCMTLFVSLIPANMESQKPVWFVFVLLMLQRAYVLGATRAPLPDSQAVSFTGNRPEVPASS